MIPRAHITEWQQNAPWVQPYQVEQDLVISRALVEMYTNADFAKNITFRGGTALYKLYASSPVRYSEDLDSVQVSPGPIGIYIDIIRKSLDPWLGKPKRFFKEGRVTLKYRYPAEYPEGQIMTLKIEINSREHFSALSFVEHAFVVESRWFTGKANILTYQFNELLGTKLRALYQRKQGRDLFDMWWALNQEQANVDIILQCFEKYMEFDGAKVSRAQFEENLLKKIEDEQFKLDLSPLITSDTDWHFDKGMKFVMEKIIKKLPGNAWKGLEE